MSKNIPDVVAVSNHLLRAGYELTEWEHRLVNAAAAQIGRDSTEWTSERPFIIEAATMRDLFDDPPENIYRSLDRAARKLMTRVITFRFTPEGRKKEIEVLEHWVRRTIYDKHAGRVILYWEDSVIPYLNDLSREFTQYQLADIAQLSGKWAPRLYQLIMTYRSIGTVEISVDELRFALQVGKSHQDVPILNRAVLKPAVDEIQRKLPHLKLAMSKRKRGRSITHFQFSFVPSTVRAERQEEQIDWVDETPSEPSKPPRTSKRTPKTKKAPQGAVQGDTREEWQIAKDNKRSLRKGIRDIYDLDW